MSRLHKKLNSLGTETGVMEMMLAGVKSALTRQPCRVHHDLMNLAAAQEAIGWTRMFKGRIFKQWIARQRDYIGNKAIKKNNALNWAATVIDCFFTQWFKVWDQRNLDCHGHDHQGRANKLKDVPFREITHLYTLEGAVPDNIRWLFQTPLKENACTGHSSASEHGLAIGKTSLKRNMLHKWRRGNWWRGITS